MNYRMKRFPSNKAECENCWQLGAGPVEGHGEAGKMDTAIMMKAKSTDKLASSLFYFQLEVTNGLIYITSYIKQQHARLPGDPSMDGF